jgi:hypothetical protein
MNLHQKAFNVFTCSEICAEKEYCWAQYLFEQNLRRMDENEALKGGLISKRPCEALVSGIWMNSIWSSTWTTYRRQQTPLLQHSNSLNKEAVVELFPLSRPNSANILPRRSSNKGQANERGRIFYSFFVRVTKIEIRRESIKNRSTFRQGVLFQLLKSFLKSKQLLLAMKNLTLLAVLLCAVLFAILPRADADYSFCKPRDIDNQNIGAYCSRFYPQTKAVPGVAGSGSGRVSGFLVQPGRVPPGG